MSDDTPPDDHQHGVPIGGGAECLLCPVCVFLQAMSQARPEVTQHLLAAARELTLALRAVVDSQAEAYERATADGDAGAGGGPGGFRRIKVD